MGGVLVAHLSLTACGEIVPLPRNQCIEFSSPDLDVAGTVDESTELTDDPKQWTVPLVLDPHGRTSRHCLSQLLVVGAPHDRHAAAAEALHQPVPAAEQLYRIHSPMMPTSMHSDTSSR